MLGVGGVRAWNIISIQVLLGIITYFIINSAHYLLDMDFDFAFCVLCCVALALLSSRLSVMTVFKLPLHFHFSLLLLIHTASGFQSDVGCLAGNQSAQTSSPGSYRMGALLSTTISTNELPPAVKEQYANK